MTKALPAVSSGVLPKPGDIVRVTIEYEGHTFVTEGMFERAEWSTDVRGTQRMSLDLVKFPASRPAGTLTVRRRSKR